MNKFSGFSKFVSTEDALYSFSMLGNLLMLLAVLGVFSRTLPFAIAAFVFFAGLIAAVVAGVIVFTRKDFFIHDIVE